MGNGGYCVHTREGEGAIGCKMRDVLRGDTTCKEALRRLIS